MLAAVSPGPRAAPGASGTSSTLRACRVLSDRKLPVVPLQRLRSATWRAHQQRTQPRPQRHLFLWERDQVKGTLPPTSTPYRIAIPASVSRRETCAERGAEQRCARRPPGGPLAGRTRRGSTRRHVTRGAQSPGAQSRLVRPGAARRCLRWRAPAKVRRWSRTTTTRTTRSQRHGWSSCTPHAATDGPGSCSAACGPPASRAFASCSKQPVVGAVRERVGAAFSACKRRCVEMREIEFTAPCERVRYVRAYSACSLTSTTRAARAAGATSPAAPPIPPQAPQSSCPPRPAGRAGRAGAAAAPAPLTAAAPRTAAAAMA